MYKKLIVESNGAPVLYIACWCMDMSLCRDK